jgi:hypothetical protein
MRLYKPILQDEGTSTMARTKRAVWSLLWQGGAVLAGAVLLGVGTGADRPASTIGTPAESKPATKGDSLQEPLALIAKAQQAYAKVNDYTCTLIKRERIRGRLTPNHVIVLKLRKSPFSVNMLWKEPRALAGQEVCWVEGKNKGDMRVKPSGLLGAIGFVSLEPDDERAKKTSNHLISDTGIGWLINEFATGWEVERKLDQTRVRIGNYEYAKRRCTRVEMIHDNRAGGNFRHYRNVVYFDQKTNLPIRNENYDWPKTPGDPGELIEMFSYVNLRANVDVPDSVFNR